MYKDKHKRPKHHIKEGMSSYL